MDYFILSADANNYRNLVFANDDDWPIVYSYNGDGIRINWKPISVVYLADETNGQLPIGDFPSFQTHIPVYSGRAVEALYPLLSSSGEILPLNSEEGTFFAHNVTNVFEVLDEPRSMIRRFSDGKVMNIEKHAFTKEKLDGVGIFKIPEERLGRVFVSEKFVVKVEQSGLKGFLFEKVSNQES